MTNNTYEKIQQLEKKILDLQNIVSKHKKDTITNLESVYSILYKKIDNNQKNTTGDIAVIINDINKIKEDSRELNYSSFINKTVEEARKDANKAKEDAEKAKNEVKDLKTQIFSVMALFFGIFTFISIDLSFTKGIMDRVKYFNNLEFIITFLFIQGLFFVAVYYFLLKPFLNTSKPSTQQSSKVKKIFIIIFLLLLVFLGIVCILNYNSICNYISQKNSIVNNPNSNNTFKATEELKKPPLP